MLYRKTPESGTSIEPAAGESAIKPCEGLELVVNDAVSDHVPVAVLLYPKTRHAYVTPGFNEGMTTEFSETPITS